VAARQRGISTPRSLLLYTENSCHVKHLPDRSCKFHLDYLRIKHLFVIGLGVQINLHLEIVVQSESIESAGQSHLHFYLYLRLIVADGGTLLPFFWMVVILGHRGSGISERLFSFCAGDRFFSSAHLCWR